MEAGGKSAVSLEVRDEGVAVITFNNPPVNALRYTQMAEMALHLITTLCNNNNQQESSYRINRTSTGERYDHFVLVMFPIGSYVHKCSVHWLIQT